MFRVKVILCPQMGINGEVIRRYVISQEEGETG